MAFVNYASREITCKIVYYGAGLGGKTTNVRQSIRAPRRIGAAPSSSWPRTRSEP